MRIAAVDDDPNQLDLIQCTLKADGHDCHTYLNGQSFMKDFRRDTFDLLIIDWHLPDTTGIELIAAVRQSAAPDIPVLLLTNRSGERDVVEGFRAGADDFVTKPARVGELRARVQSLLRRAYQASRPERYIWEPYRFVRTLQSVEIDGRSVQLTQKEFELALLFFRNMGRLLSRRYLLETVWTLNNPPDTDLMSRSLDTHISRIRNALCLRPGHGYRLSAVYGQGYRLESVADIDTDPSAPSFSTPR